MLFENENERIDDPEDDDDDKYYFDGYKLFWLII
jgi:hypothetical protein